MLSTNHGYRVLTGIADRSGQLEQTLEDWAQCPAVYEFVSSYAASLSEGILDLVKADAVLEASEACVQSMEELLAQAQDVAAGEQIPQPVPSNQPLLPGVEHAPSADLPMAA